MLGEDCLAGEMAFFVCRIWQSCRLVAVGDGVWFERDLQEGGIRRIFGMGAGSFLGGSGAGWGRRGWRSGFDFYP